MQLQYVVFGAIAALAGFITSLMLTFRNIRSSTKLLDNYLQVAEEKVDKEILEIGFDELKLTPAGRELLALIGSEEALAKLKEPVPTSVLGDEIIRVDLSKYYVATNELEALRDSIKDFETETLKQTEKGIDDTFAAVLGSLAEEASSEIVQKELEAMSKAVLETVENIQERSLAVTASLEEIAQEFTQVNAVSASKEELAERIQKARVKVEARNKEYKSASS